MTDILNLCDLLIMQADDTPDKPAFVFPEASGRAVAVSFSQLDRNARHMAGFLQTQKLVGDRAILLFPQGPEFLTAFFGCFYAGVGCVPVAPPETSEELDYVSDIIADADASVILTTFSILTVLKKLKILHGVASVPVLDATGRLFLSKVGLSRTLSYGNLPIVAVDELDLEYYTSFNPPYIQPHTLAYLQYPQKKTTPLAALSVSHANVLSALEMVADQCGFEPDDAIASCFPFYTTMGVIFGVCLPLCTGCTGYVFQEQQLYESPSLWLELISRYAITVTASPSSFFAKCFHYCSENSKAALSLAAWRMAVVEADNPFFSAMRHFLPSFSQNGVKFTSFVSVFGTMENAFLLLHGDASLLQRNNGSSFVRNTTTGNSSYFLLSAGYSFPNEMVRIMIPGTTTECADGQVGEIWVCGDHVPKDYWMKEALSKRKFLQIDGYFPFVKTALKGYAEDGVVYVVERVD